MRAVLLIALLALAGPAAAQIPSQLPRGVDPVAYDLTLTPDPERLTFEARVEVRFKAAAPTQRIVLNAAGLEIAEARLDGRPAAVSLNAAAETATFSAPRPIARGGHSLSIAYRGRILDGPAGFFHIDQGGKRMLATQFEPSDARRLLPVFDEPAKKAVFALTAIVPQGQLALSNMPEAASEPLAGGLRKVRFQPTPPMSSYLLFFGLGDLERLSAEADGVVVSVVMRRGEQEKGRYALQAATQLLHDYDAYFGVKYPLPKLDLVGAPGEVGGSMENWGAILFSDYHLTVDPAADAAADRQLVFNTVAHEMAHQWFGDLVTMAWWDDLWLNEGFANWMATKATVRLHPEWSPQLDALGDKDRAMRTDAQGAAHP